MTIENIEKIKESIDVIIHLLRQQHNFDERIEKYVKEFLKLVLKLKRIKRSWSQAEHLSGALTGSGLDKYKEVLVLAGYEHLTEQLKNEITAKNMAEKAVAYREKEGINLKNKLINYRNQLRIKEKEIMNRRIVTLKKLKDSIKMAANKMIINLYNLLYRYYNELDSVISKTIEEINKTIEYGKRNVPDLF